MQASNANNRAELSHQPTRVRERGMRRFKSRRQVQRFLDVHAAVYNLFKLGRHLTAARHYRELRHRKRGSARRNFVRYRSGGNSARSPESACGPSGVGAPPPRRVTTTIHRASGGDASAVVFFGDFGTTFKYERNQSGSSRITLNQQGTWRVRLPPSLNPPVLLLQDR